MLMSQSAMYLSGSGVCNDVFLHWNRFHAVARLQNLHLIDTLYFYRWIHLAMVFKQNEPREPLNQHVDYRACEPTFWLFFNKTQARNIEYVVAMNCVAITAFSRL